MMYDVLCMMYVVILTTEGRKNLCTSTYVSRSFAMLRMTKGNIHELYIIHHTLYIKIYSSSGESSSSFFGYLMSTLVKLKPARALESTRPGRKLIFERLMSEVS